MQLKVTFTWEPRTEVYERGPPTITDGTYRVWIHGRRTGSPSPPEFTGFSIKLREDSSIFPSYPYAAMAKTTDERGRIYLPKDVRDRFGDRYRIVELPSHVALFPVDEDPLEGLRAAVGDAFEGKTVSELKARARGEISREVTEEANRRTDRSEE